MGPVGGGGADSSIPVYGAGTDAFQAGPSFAGDAAGGTDAFQTGPAFGSDDLGTDGFQAGPMDVGDGLGDLPGASGGLYGGVYGMGTTDTDDAPQPEP